MNEQSGQGCKHCERKAEYELVDIDGAKIPLCPQCAFAVVFGEVQIMIVEARELDDYSRILTEARHHRGKEYIN